MVRQIFILEKEQKVNKIIKIQYRMRNSSYILFNKIQLRAYVTVTYISIASGIRPRHRQHNIIHVALQYHTGDTKLAYLCTAIRGTIKSD